MSDANFEAEAQAWRWLQAHMPIEVQAALDKFVSINPHYKGAEWWDVLSVLRDSDSHLDIIEPMVQAMSYEDGETWSVLYSFVTLTLIYTNEHFATMQTTNMRVSTVRTTIANNGQL